MEISIYNFMDVMRKTLYAVDWSKHLRNTCRRLRVVFVWKEPPDEVRHTQVQQDLGQPFTYYELESDEENDAEIEDINHPLPSL